MGYRNEPKTQRSGENNGLSGLVNIFCKDSNTKDAWKDYKLGALLDMIKESRRAWESIDKNQQNSFRDKLVSRLENLNKIKIRSPTDIQQGIMFESSKKESVRQELLSLHY